MEYTAPQVDSEETEPIIVKADEVDEAGADISIISPICDASESEFNARIESRRAQDALPSGSPKQLANAVDSPPKASSRPILRREGSTPAPPKQLPPRPPPPAQEEPSNGTDSLSLGQLKKLVTDLPKLEPTAYAYKYSETRSFPEELQEWFPYRTLPYGLYLVTRAKESFEGQWGDQWTDCPDKEVDWTVSDEVEKEKFFHWALNALDDPDLGIRVYGIECLSYIALGVWGETAGADLEGDGPTLLPEDKDWLDSQTTKPQAQLQWIVRGAEMLCRYGVIKKLLDMLTNLIDNVQSVSPLSAILQSPLLLRTNMLDVEMRTRMNQNHLKMMIRYMSEMRNAGKLIRRSQSFTA